MPLYSTNGAFGWHGVFILSSSIMMSGITIIMIAVIMIRSSITIIIISSSSSVSSLTVRYMYLVNSRQLNSVSLLLVEVVHAFSLAVVEGTVD